MGEGAQINQLRDLCAFLTEDLPVTTITITDHGFHEGQRVIYAPEGETLSMVWCPAKFTTSDGKFKAAMSALVASEQDRRQLN